MAKVDPKRMAALLRLSRHVEEARLLSLKRASDALAENSRDITKLQGGRHMWDAADPSRSETRAARDAGVPEAWMAWTDSAISKAVATRAELVDRRARSEADARNAVGRRGVLEAIAKRVAKGPGRKDG